MNELSIKEKAKAYDEAIERAKEKYAMFEGMQAGDVLEDVFPSLKESEDEKIRKVLIDYFNQYKEQEECGVKTFYGISTDDILAWLEKHSELQNISFKGCWSTGDDVRLTSTIQVLEYARSLPDYNQFGKEDIDNDIQWLNFLKQRYN